MFPINIFYTQVYKPSKERRLIDNEHMDMAIMLGKTPLSDRYLENRIPAHSPMTYISAQSPALIAKKIRSYIANPIITNNQTGVIEIPNVSREKTLSLMRRIREDTIQPPFL